MSSEVMVGVVFLDRACWASCPRGCQKADKRISQVAKPLLNNVCILVPSTSWCGSCHFAVQFSVGGLLCCDGDWLLFWENSVVSLTFRCVSPLPRGLVLWDDLFFSYSLPVLFSLWFSFHYCTTLHRGSESPLMNRAFILLTSATLMDLSVAGRAVSHCFALSWALHMNIQMYFFSSQDLTLIFPPLCSWASLLTTLCVFFILACSRGFHWGYWLWLALTELEIFLCYHCCGAYQLIGFSYSVIVSSTPLASDRSYCLIVKSFLGV